MMKNRRRVIIATSAGILTPALQNLFQTYLNQHGFTRYGSSTKTTPPASTVRLQTADTP